MIDTNLIEVVDLYNHYRFGIPLHRREQKRLLNQIREIKMLDPLETLTEISNEFEISYQRFQESSVVNWCVTLKTQPNNLKGRGDTLEDAIQDMHRQQDLRNFESQLSHAKLGSNSVEEMKEKIRTLL